MKSDDSKKTLILCVDRDDDLGSKTKIKTPINGRNKNLKAATDLALSDPEEADANAMFEAVRVFDRLNNERKNDEILDIATITGSEFGGVGADRKIVDQLNEVLKNFPANEVILVNSN